MRFLTKRDIEPIQNEMARLKLQVSELGGTIVGACHVCGSTAEVVYPLYIQNPNGRYRYKNVWICGCCIEDVKIVIRKLDKRREERDADN